MKKRIYRAKNVNEIKMENLAGIGDGQPIVFGVDVAKEDYVGALMNTNYEAILTAKWKHPQETLHMIAQLKKLPTQNIEVVLESTGTYGKAFAEAIQRCELKVYQVSPKRVHDAAELYDGVPSTHDAKCAAIIAYLHLLKRSSPIRERQRRKSR